MDRIISQVVRLLIYLLGGFSGGHPVLWKVIYPSIKQVVIGRGGAVQETEALD